MNIFFCEQIEIGSVSLNEQESHHCARVLRMNEGDDVHLFDGNGKTAQGQILFSHKKGVRIEVNQIKTHEKPTRKLHLAFSPLKSNERNEWILEKATELSVDELSMVLTANSERKKVNIDRYRTIILNAAKQSKNPFLPKLNDVLPFEEFISATGNQQFIATLLETNDDQFTSFEQANQATVLIGPEGGFSPTELNWAISNKWRPISLGNQRLRAETAAIYVAMCNYRRL